MKEKTTPGFYVTASLKGISQVILIENAMAGLLILAAVFITSWQLGIIAFLSAMIGTCSAKFLGADQAAAERGLFGYNAVLAGMGLFLFLKGPAQWGLALLGAFFTVLVSAALMHLFKKWDLPVLTLPFILLTWAMLLSAYRLGTVHLSPDLVPQSLSRVKLEAAGSTNWLEGLVNGFGQIFFIEHNISCLLILAAVFYAGWHIGLFAIFANLLSIAAAYLLGGDTTLITLGLYGYNAILAVLAVSVDFHVGSRMKSIIAGTLAAVLSVFMTATVSAMLLPYGLPSLTMPFVLTSWLILSARKILPAL